MKNIVTVLVVIAAVVIAWFVVNAIFSLMWFVAKLVVVAVVAVAVYGLLRLLLSRASD